MKKVVMVLGVVAPLAVAGISAGVANAKQEGQELKVDALVTEITPRASITPAKGEAAHAELDLFEEGDAGA